MTRPTEWDLRLFASDELVVVVDPAPARSGTAEANASGGATDRSRSPSLVGEGRPKTEVPSVTPHFDPDSE